MTGLFTIIAYLLVTLNIWSTTRDYDKTNGGVTKEDMGDRKDVKLQSPKTRRSVTTALLHTYHYEQFVNS